MTDWHRVRSAWTPPAVSRWASRRIPGRITFAEFPGTWEQAVESVSGYGDESILERVATSTRQVEQGAGAFERDSVVFPEPEYVWPMLAALEHRAAVDGRLSVLDFGGALGSAYRQHRAFLDDLAHVSWGVVEQPAFVAAGAAEFTTERLSFHHTIDACVQSIRPNVVLLGSVLQYLSDPHAALTQLFATGARTLIIDRTPASESKDDVLCIQHVPPTIYSASYPMWVLSASRLASSAPAGWALASTYDSVHGRMITEAGLPFEWSGAIFRADAT
jgi:putative methyltransferase (TIGR04325 family)